MGPEWVASRTRYGHNGTNTLDRIGQSLSNTFNRIRGRPTQQQSDLGAAEQGRAEDNGAVQLQSMAPIGNPVDGRVSSPMAVEEPVAIVSIPPPPLDEVRPSTHR
ncbi:hypothetical protein EC991_010602 [Linnemannia zychae]|nr:hypothetical protein EC991_010602 [Linnemannia zychae]